MKNGATPNLLPGRPQQHNQCCFPIWLGTHITITRPASIKEQSAERERERKASPPPLVEIIISISSLAEDFRMFALLRGDCTGRCMGPARVSIVKVSTSYGYGVKHLSKCARARDVW